MKLNSKIKNKRKNGTRRPQSAVPHRREISPGHIRTEDKAMNEKDKYLKRNLAT